MTKHEYVLMIVAGFIDKGRGGHEENDMKNDIVICPNNVSSSGSHKRFADVP